MSQTPTEIAIAVVEHNGRFLVGRRPDDVALGGLWEFPGGKVEGDETAAAAARRECLEETGLLVEIRAQFPSRVQQYDHDRLKLHFFDCVPVAVNQKPKPPFRWIARSDLADCEFPSGNRGILDLLLSGET